MKKGLVHWAKPFLNGSRAATEWNTAKRKNAASDSQYSMISHGIASGSPVRRSRQASSAFCNSDRLGHDDLGECGGWRGPSIPPPSSEPLRAGTPCRQRPLVE